MSSLSMRQFAKIVGVHYATVSRVFNNHPGVSEVNRQRILDEAQRLGFKPSRKARSLKLNKTFTVGMVTPSLSNSFWGNTILSIQKYLDKRGYHLVFSPCWEEEHGTLHAVKFLQDREVDAFIISANNLYSHSDHQAIMKITKKSKKPVLLFVTKWDKFSYSFLGHAAEKDMEQACNFLLELGHQKIAIMASSDYNPGSENRIKGCTNALNKSGIPVDNLTILHGGYGYDDGIIAAKEFLQLKLPTTAIIASNDIAACGLYSVFHQKGIQIPGDVSVIGYGGMFEGSILTPPLTTIANQFEFEGQRAVEIIIDMIENDSTEQVIEEIPGHLVIRKSCSSVMR